MRKKAMSGGAKLMAAGRKPILLGPTEEQHARLAAAAAVDGRPITQYMLHHMLALSEKILKKSGKSA